MNYLKTESIYFFLAFGMNKCTIVLLKLRMDLKPLSLLNRMLLERIVTADVKLETAMF